MPYDVFLSYNTQDYVAVREIAGKLHEHGIHCFFDRWYLPKGQPWRSLLEKNLTDSKAVAVFIGPHGMGPWQHREIDMALDMQGKRVGFPVIPVLLPGSEPPPGFLGLSTWIDHRNLPLEQLLELLEKSIRGEPPGPYFEAQVAAAKAAVCPYRGLLYFREEDAPFFFGREAAVEELCKAVDKASFVAVVGASGSGKSSVAWAGLVPRLRRERGTVWEITSLVPGDEPLKSLAGAVVPLLFPELNPLDRRAEINKLAENFANKSISLCDMVRDVLAQQKGTQRLLLIADQWEEIYTLTKDDAQRNRFIDELLDATTRAPLTVVLTLRVDFSGDVLDCRPLSDRLQNAQVNLANMTAEELGRAVRLPAQKVELQFETGLDARILADVGNKLGNLPLLEFVLRELWENRQGNRLLHASYEKMGELHGAVAAKAEALFTKLSLPEQEATRMLFLQLVHISEEGNYTRRRERIADIPEAAHELVRRMADERLLITGGGAEAGEEESVEVAHEVLIWHWERLTGWLNEDRAFLFWRERLRAFMEAWRNSNQSEELLLRGPVLAEAEEWLVKRSESLIEGEKEFIRASIEAREAREEEERAQRKILVTIAAVAVVFAVGAVVAAMFYLGQLAESNRQLARAQVEEGRAWVERSKLNSSRGNNFAAAVMAARAIGFSGWGRESVNDTDFEKTYPILVNAEHAPADKREAGELVQKAVLNSPTGFPLWQSPIVRHHAGSVSSVSWSPDGKRLASGGGDRAVKLWEVSTGKLLSTLDGHTSSVSSLSWSPDGETLVSGGWDSTVKLWDVHRGKLLTTLQGHTGPVLSVTWSPDGRTVASGGRDKTVKLWETRTGKLLTTFEGHTGEVRSVMWSPGGKILASAGTDKTVKLWDVSANKLLRALEGHASYINSITWSPDGKRLASGGTDKTVNLWDVGAGTLLSSLKGNRDEVASVMWSPDGKRLASGGRDNTVKIWEVSTGKLLSTMEGHTGEITSVTWSPDGMRLASGGWDSTVKLWEMSTGKLLTIVEGHTGGVSSATWSPDGTRLASGSWDNTVKLWEVSTGKLLNTLKGHSREVTSVSWSPDGETLASGSGDRTVKLWEVSTGKLLRTLEGHTGEVRSVTWSPDGKRLASGGGDKTVKLWEVSTGKLLSSLEGHTSVVSSVTWGPFGTILASGGWDNSLKTWEVSTGKLLSTLEGQSGEVTSVSWSPDGRMLVSGCRDSKVKLWKVSTGKLVSSLEGHKGEVFSVTWSPDGKRLASGSGDGTVKLWEAGTGKLLSSLEGHTDSVRNVSWSPDGKTLASGGWDKTVKIWDVSMGKLLGTLEGHTGIVRSVSWSPDGKTLASGALDNTVMLWEVGAGKLLSTLEGHTSYVTNVMWSPDGKRLASGGGDNTVRIWEVSTRRLLGTLEGHTGPVTSATWSPDGNRLASGGWDKTVKIWEASTGKLLRSIEGHTGEIFSVMWSPDGKRLASGSTDKTARLWEAGTGQLLSTLEGHTSYVNIVWWSPDGKTLATGGGDNVVKLWDVSAGKLQRTLEGHMGEVTSVSWSPDGKTLASGGMDNTVKLWKVGTAELLSTLDGFTSYVNSISWSPDGNTLALGGWDNTVKLWEVPKAAKINLATYFSGRWVDLVGGQVIWTNVTDNLFQERSFPVLNVRADTLPGLADRQLPAAEHSEAEMRLLLAAQNFPGAVSVWSAQAAKVPADATIRRLFLSAACAQAADDLEKDLDWRACWLVFHIAPALTPEAFSDPAVSLGTLRLATRLAGTSSPDPQIASARDAFMVRLKTVAPPFWQEAFSQPVR